MNKEQLKKCAELLDQEIFHYSEKNVNVKRLSLNNYLAQAICDAKAGLIDQPASNDGLMRWIMESDIKELPPLTRLLLDFIYLLRGDADVSRYL